MHISCHYKRLRLKRLKVALFAVVISLFFMPNFIKYEKSGENLYSLTLNGVHVGTLASFEDAKECLLAARKNISKSSQKLVFADMDLSYEAQSVVFGRIDKKANVASKMEDVLRQSVVENLNRAYEMKINGYIVTLDSTDEILRVLQTAIDKYDPGRKFKVSLASDLTRELPVLVPSISTREEVKAEEEAKEQGSFYAGFDQDMIDLFEKIKVEASNNMDVLEWDYISKEYSEPKINSIGYGDEIEVVEVFVNPTELTDVEVAISELTDEELTNQIYKVVSGDTLSGISQKVEIPIETLVAINDTLEDQNSVLHIDQELIITVPEPKLPIVREVVEYSENTYQEPAQIIENDEWFTSEKVVHVQPSDGYRKMIATVTYENDSPISDPVPIREEITCLAVAKVIEKGTKIPPSYIKPIYGGRVTSNFGYRKRPTKGASTYHKGVDWAVPTGTPVYASCGGTVAKAGWGSGYGYVVYINHPDGKQTRYGHCSKVLVSAGQSVSQGQKIALSGNTGVSTGPHLHFEILVGGSQTNPFNYVSR